VEWTDLFRALALVCVIEGLMPLLAPVRWRETLAQLTEADTSRIRLFGGALVVTGLVALQFIT